jgi:hypothetical protein
MLLVGFALHLQPAFGIYRSPASISRGGYGLTVPVIGHISGDKDSRSAAHSVLMDLQVTDLIHLQETPEDVSIGPMSYSYKESLHR